MRLKPRIGPLPYTKTASGNGTIICVESLGKCAGSLSRKATCPWSPTADLHRLGAANDRTASFLLCLHTRRVLETHTSDQYFGWWCSASVVGLYIIVAVGASFSLDVSLLIAEHTLTCLFHYATFQGVAYLVQLIQCRMSYLMVFVDVVPQTGIGLLCSTEEDRCWYTRPLLDLTSRSSFEDCFSLSRQC